MTAFGRYGRIPLAQEGEGTEFSTISWVAMMFSAGMGIGLMFFGVYEPVTHMTSPPPFVEAQAGTQEAARQSMAYTLFHWALHPWAIYSVVGLAIAYSTFRMGRGNLISAPFQGLFGAERIEKKGWGKPIDVLALICTKFGTATSMGLGALQIASGLALLSTGEFQEDPGKALPITVISRQELEQSGDISVADFLRETTFNSFGSYQSTSGSSGAGATTTTEAETTTTGAEETTTTEAMARTTECCHSAIGVATTVFSAWRWCLVARGLGMRLSLRGAIADYYKALFINAALPGGVLGDVDRAVQHGREEGDVGRSVRAVVLERTAGQVVLVSVGLTVLLTVPSPVLSHLQDKRRHLKTRSDENKAAIIRIRDLDSLRDEVARNYSRS